MCACADEFLATVTGAVVHGVYQVVNRSSFGVFIYLGFYVAFNTVQVISRRVVGRAEETST